MPHDPDTFKNLYPFPDKGKIRESIQNKILSGELKVPVDYILDSKEWVDGMVGEEFKVERRIYECSQCDADDAWQEFQEKEHGFANLPETLRQKIHRQVWEDGHSGGYGEMENRYLDLVPLILEAFQLGKDQSVAGVLQNNT